MNEEERKAVEILNTFELRRKTKNYKEISLEDSQSVETLLNLIEKLQEENEKLKEYKKIAELTKISCCIAQNCEALNNAIKSELENQKLKKELNDINQKWNRKVEDMIEELNQEDREWTEELSEPDSDFRNIDRNLKRIKNQVDILQKVLKGRK